MDNKLKIYIMGDYRAGAADGLLEFNYQTVQLLKDDFLFHFVEFDDQQNTTYTQEQVIDGFPIYRFGTKGLSQLRLPHFFVDWIKKLPKQNAIFHLNHIHNLPNYLEARLFQKLKIPYVITPHDSFVYHPDYKHNKSFLKRWYKLAFVTIFDKYVLDNAILIHGITQQCPVSLRHITKSAVFVVTNQVKDVAISFDPSIIESQICFIGRFNIFTKGIDRALTTFQLFLANRKDKEDVRFTLVGPADLQATETVKQLCQDLELRIGKDVILAGKVSESERNTILSRSKVYLQLSRSEGFGLSIAQALSCFKPVIVSKEVPIHDKIIAHKAGYVVNNPEEASQALDAIYALSAADYQQMAMNARNCYEQEFHPRAIKPQLINLYKKAMANVIN